MNTEGKVAVITGASRGIGAGLAEYFHGQGMKLGLCARSTPVLAGEKDVVSACFDIREENPLEEFATQVAEQHGPIDIWINNAGILEPVGPLRSLARDDVQRHLEVNVMGVFLGSQVYLKHLYHHRNPGVLINISSGAATAPYRGWSAYCAGKAAVDLLSGCIGEEEKDLDLRVHAVAPGIIDTQMQEVIRNYNPEDFPDVERFKKFKADEAFSTPEFVAEKILRLAFDPKEQSDEVIVRLPPEFPDRF